MGLLVIIGAGVLGFLAARRRRRVTVSTAPEDRTGLPSRLRDPQTGEVL